MTFLPLSRATAESKSEEFYAQFGNEEVPSFTGNPSFSYDDIVSMQDIYNQVLTSPEGCLLASEEGRIKDRNGNTWHHPIDAVKAVRKFLIG